MTRKYSSTSVEQLLSSSIGAGDTTLSLANSAAVTALLGGVSLAAGNVDQFTIAIDPDTASEEIVFVRGTSGNQLTGLVRGQAGTSGTTHSSGATIKHVLTSDDLDYYVSSIDNALTTSNTATLTNKTIALGSNTVSGTTAQFNTALTDGNFATLAGTETLTNKTINLSSNTLTATSAQLASAVSDETGSGALVFGTSPTLTTPVINDAKQTVAINAQTGTTYTFVLDDNGKLVTASNGSAQTYTIPPNSSVAFPTGSIINIIQIGTGQVSFAQGSGVTIASNGATSTAPKLRAQYSAASAIKVGTDLWYVVGDIS